MVIARPAPPSRLPVARAAAAPVESEPADRFFESAREIALLPILDPAVCASVMMAGVIAGMGGGAGLSAAAPVLHAVLDGRSCRVAYDFGEHGMDASGSMEDRSVAETVRSVGTDRVRLFGRFGKVQENLLVRVGEHGVRMTGRANGLEVDLEYSLGWQNHPSAGLPRTWCDVRGTVGGLPYKAQASLSPNVEDGDQLAAIMVEGQLGEQKINKAYVMSTDESMSQVVLAGGGQVAGAEQSIRVELGLSATGLLAR